MTGSPPEHELPPCEFFGRYRLKLDDKGRVTLPSLLRRALPTGAKSLFLLRQGSDDPYVQMIPVHEWNRLQGRREAAGGLTGRELRWSQRTFKGGVVPVQLDPKGRFSVAGELTEANGIGEEILIQGVGRVLELWDPTTFFDLLAKNSMDPKDVDDLLYG